MFLGRMRRPTLFDRIASSYGRVTYGSFWPSAWSVTHAKRGPSLMPLDASRLPHADCRARRFSHKCVAIEPARPINPPITTPTKPLASIECLAFAGTAACSRGHRGGSLHDGELSMARCPPRRRRSAAGCRLLRNWPTPETSGQCAVASPRPTRGRNWSSVRCYSNSGQTPPRLDPLKKMRERGKR